MKTFFSALTFLQLVLHHHQEGDTYHEEVEAETDFTELPHSSSAHLTHHVLIRLLSADRRGVAEDDQTADEENQRNLQGQRDRNAFLFFIYTQTHTMLFSSFSKPNSIHSNHLFCFNNSTKSFS